MYVYIYMLNEMVHDGILPFLSNTDHLPVSKYYWIREDLIVFNRVL